MKECLSISSSSFFISLCLFDDTLNRIAVKGPWSRLRARGNCFYLRYISVSFYFALFILSDRWFVWFMNFSEPSTVLISARHSTILNCRPQIPRETAFDRPQSRVPVEIGVRMAPSVISITTRSSVGPVGYRQRSLNNRCIHSRTGVKCRNLATN